MYNLYIWRGRCNCFDLLYVFIIYSNFIFLTLPKWFVMHSSRVLNEIFFNFRFLSLAFVNFSATKFNNEVKCLKNFCESCNICVANCCKKGNIQRKKSKKWMRVSRKTWWTDVSAALLKEPFLIFYQTKTYDWLT